MVATVVFVILVLMVGCVCQSVTRGIVRRVSRLWGLCGDLR